MRGHRFYLGLLVAILLATMAALGCGATEGAESASVAPSSSSTADVPLTSAKAALLKRIDQVRTGLADGTWVFDPTAVPFSPPSTDVNDPDITVYLKDSATDAGTLQKQIEAMPEVAGVSYVSKEEALARIKEDFKDSPEILEGLTGNPLPASLEVWLKDRSEVSVTSVVQKLQGRPEVDEIQARELVSPPTDLFSDVSAQELLDEAEYTLYLPDIAVYLKASVVDATRLQTEIAAMPGVAKVGYVSSEEAMARLRDDFKDNPEILAGVEANVLPGSFEIWLNDVSQLEILAGRLQSYPEVDEVRSVLTDVADQAELTLGMFRQK